MKLPDMATTIDTLHAKTEAVDTVSAMIERNLELEEIFELLQPLLHALSSKLYKDDEPVSLGKLIVDSVEWIKSDGNIVDVKFKE